MGLDVELQLDNHAVEPETGTKGKELVEPMKPNGHEVWVRVGVARCIWITLLKKIENIILTV